MLGLHFFPGYHCKGSQEPCLGKWGAIILVLLPPSSLETPHHPGMLHFGSAVGMSPGHEEEHARREKGYCCSRTPLGEEKQEITDVLSLLHGHFWFHSDIVHNTPPLADIQGLTIRSSGATEFYHDSRFSS